MSLAEWLGEAIDPGGKGTVELGRGPRTPQSRTRVVVIGVLALAAVAGWLYCAVWLLGLPWLGVALGSMA